MKNHQERDVGFSGKDLLSILWMSLMTLLLQLPMTASDKIAESNLPSIYGVDADRTCQASDGTCSAVTTSIQPECHLFLAESSIPNSGLGMYTSIPIPIDEYIFYPDVVLNHADISRNQDLRREKHKVPEESEKEWLPDSYVWDKHNTHSNHECEEVDSLVPGLGMLANSHTGLVNAIMDRPKIDGAGLHRSKDPGVGAFSNFHNLRFYSVQDVPAGMELFVEYGDVWFSEREGAFGPVPLSDDFANADKILTRFMDLVMSGSAKDEALAKDLWFLVRDLIASNARLSMALPVDFESAIKSREMSAALMSVKNAIRSQQWLEENGRCLDNIKPGPSTIQQAGRGAFATRFLKKGQIIAPAPMVHIHRHHLIIWQKFSLDEEEERNVNIEEMGQQLILNYCFGHRDSNLLLFPYAPVVNFINHKSTGDGANAKIQWSVISSHNADWKNKSVDDVMSEDHAGLVMEFVAICNIEEGEEVFIDYGPQWQDAWDSHVLNWKPVDGAADYVSAEELTKDNPVLKTPEEQEEDPYPDHIETVCFVPSNIQDKRKDVGEFGPAVQWHFQDKMLRFLDEALSCTILSRDMLQGDNVNNQTYTVQAEIDDETSLVIWDIPRYAIEFVDLSYSSDQFLRSAFRHEIHISDHDFPTKWLDLKKSSAEKRSDQCELFLAESSIPNAGLGLYTGVAHTEGESISFPDMMIQSDYRSHRNLGINSLNASRADLKEWLLSDYVWNAQNTHGVHDATQVSSITPGIGMLMNGHSALSNVAMERPSKDDAGLHRKKDPGAGAITNYHKTHFIAAAYQPAGMELFSDYGDQWFQNREKEYGPIPLKKHYEKADKVLENYWGLVDEKSDGREEYDQDSWSMTREGFAEDTHLYQALPFDVREARRAFEMGTALYSVPNAIRSIDWLLENGHCVDNMKSAPSTVPEAGRGAFATRKLKEGDVIAPMPLIHVTRDMLHQLKQEGGSVYHVGEQLLLNYCYGHQNSSLLLFPYSPIVNFVNCNRDGGAVNAKLQWSSMSHHKAEWLKETVQEVMTHESPGLVMDLVAARDIEAGDEIFLDYGQRWRDAWDTHVLTWAPPDGAENHVPASKLNIKHRLIRAETEEEENPYPENVMTICIVPRNIKQQGEHRDGPFGKERLWFSEGALLHDGDNGRPCRILDWSTDGLWQFDSIVVPESYYIANVTMSPDDGDVVLVGAIPRMAIEIVDRPYTMDQFMPNVFRHEIGLPDELFPTEWLDLR